LLGVDDPLLAVKAACHATDTLDHIVYHGKAVELCWISTYARAPEACSLIARSQESSRCAKILGRTRSETHLEIGSHAVGQK
jgi:hypothetical protein